MNSIASYVCKYYENTLYQHMPLVGVLYVGTHYSMVPRWEAGRQYPRHCCTYDAAVIAPWLPVQGLQFACCLLFTGLVLYHMCPNCFCTDCTVGAQETNIRHSEYRMHVVSIFYVVEYTGRRNETAVLDIFRSR